jgi:hypothetical protein
MWNLVVAGVVAATFPSSQPCEDALYVQATAAYEAAVDWRSSRSIDRFPGPDGTDVLVVRADGRPVFRGRCDRCGR